MKNTSERFNNAITKLYNAFHNGLLDSYDCSHCAVGNICGNKSEWARLRIFGGDDFIEEPYKDVYSLSEYAEGLDLVSKTGYTGFEVIEIEKIFLRYVPFDLRINKDAQFKGLEAVVEYLCELEGIENVMDYSKLFEYTEENKPVYENILK